MFYPYTDPHRCFFCSHTQDVVFTLPGALGGVLFVFAALFSFVAIPRAGLATAQAVWSLVRRTSDGKMDQNGLLKFHL